MVAWDCIWSVADKTEVFLSVADIVEAMASHRPYRPSLGIEEALKEIVDKSGTFFDKDIIEICLKLFKEKKFNFDNVDDDNMI